MHVLLFFSYIFLVSIIIIFLNMKSQYQNKIFYNKVDIPALNLRLNVGSL